MIDFDRLVLRPAQAVFARPIAFLPKGGRPFLGRGDFRRPTEMVDIGDGEMTTALPTLGIRASEFVILPRQDDELYVGILRSDAAPGYEVLPTSRRFKVMDVKPDGEGDVKLVLAEVSHP